MSGDSGTGDSAAGDSAAGDSQRPPLRLVRGDASAEELAALLAVLSAAAGEDAETAPPVQRSEWASRERSLRRMPSPGRDGWRASGLPR